MTRTMLNRRKFMANAAAYTTFLGTSVNNKVVRAQEAGLGSLEDDVLTKVKALAANRSVRLKLLYPIGSLGNVEPVVEAFYHKTGVNISLLEAPLDDINTQILLSKLSNQYAFDIALPATFGIPDLAQSGAIKNLDDFAKEYEPPEFQEESLYSVGDYYKGSLYGYQTDGDAYVMFYNGLMLDDEREQETFAEKYGRPLAIPKTWAELTETMAHFHRPEQGQFGGSLFRTIDYLPWEWWIRFHSKGFYPLNDAAEAQINNVAGVEALEEMIEATAYLDPRTKSDGLFDNWKTFSQGHSFCNIGWGGSQKFFNGPESQVRGKLKFGPTPGGLVEGQLLQTPYFNWGWNYVVANGSKEPEISYLFALFACSGRVSTKAVGFSEGYFDPFREEHYQDQEIIRSYSEPFLKTHRESMRQAIPDLYLNGQGDYFAALRENLGAAFIKSMSPKEALDRTAAQWRQITFRLGQESQREQWAFLKSRYPSHLRGLLK